MADHNAIRKTTKILCVPFLTCLICYSAIARGENKVVAVSSIFEKLGGEEYYFYLQGPWQQSTPCDGENYSEWIVFSKNIEVIKSMLEIVLSAMEMDRILLVKQETCTSKHPTITSLYIGPG